MGLDYMERRPGPKALDAQQKQQEQEAQRPDQVEKMHPGARAEVDDFADEMREEDSARGPEASEHPAEDPGGVSGEHSGQKPTRSRPARRREP